MKSKIRDISTKVVKLDSEEFVVEMEKLLEGI